MAEQNYFIMIRVLLCLVLLEGMAECRYWKTRLVKIDLSLNSFTGNSSARTVLSCSRFCDKPGPTFFFFSDEEQQCQCGMVDNFTEDASQEEVVFGEWEPANDCLEHYQNGYIHDGIYMIEPNPGLRTTAWCDMRNGGWTVIQRRLDGSVNFYRNWAEYARGFGDPTGEYWIGLDNIHYLTLESPELHISLETFGDVTQVDGYASYKHFSVADASLMYRLTLDSTDYGGNVADMLANGHGMGFTTYDRDNDRSGRNCASYHSGAWWYNACYHCNLNGLYLNGTYTSHQNGMTWLNPWGVQYSLKTVIMKVKRPIT